jgi:outer membrane protein TolC
MYLKSDLFKTLALVISLTSAFPIWAQAPQSLSLEEAVSLALANNYQVQLSRAAVAIAENNDDWALAGKSPNVNLSLSSNNSYSNTDNPASVVTQSAIYSNGLVPGVNASWLLYNGSRIEYTKDQFSKQVDLSNEQLRVQLQNTVQSVIQAYYGALVQREQLTVLEEVLTLSRDRIRYQEARQEFGQASSFDLLQAQDAYLNDSTTYLVQQNAFQNALRNLQLLMGQEGAANYQLTDQLESNENAISFAELEQQLINNNPELKASNVNIQLAELNTQIQSTDRLPQVSLNAGGTYNINQSNGTQTFNFGGMPDERDLPGVSAKTFNGFVNLSATYNIFDGGARKRRIQTASLQEVQSQLQYKSLSQNLRTQLANTFATFENQKRLVNLTNELVNNARQNLEISEERLRGGLINSFDYRSIQLAFINANQAQLNAILNLKNTETELRRLTGGLLQ